MSATEDELIESDFEREYLAYERTLGVEADRFMRRLDLAAFVFAANVKDLRECTRVLTEPATAKHLLRPLVPPLMEQSLLTLSQRLFNALSALYALQQGADSFLDQRRLAKESRWRAIQDRVEVHKAEPEVRVALAVRHYAVHRDTIKTGFSRRMTPSSDTWSVYVAKSTLAGLELKSTEARSHFDSLSEELTPEALVGPLLGSVQRLRTDMSDAIRQQFGRELVEMERQEKDLLARYPGRFSRTQRPDFSRAP